MPVGNSSNGGPMQKFLVHGFSGQTSVPEPGDLILFGTVLGSLGLAKCRKKRQA